VLAGALARLRSFLRALGRRARFERELDDELRFHLEARADDLVRAGLDRRQAMRRARLELGPADAHKDEVRAARGLRLADELAADLRFALRGWRKHRGLALAVTVILTVGLGVSTAGFTLVSAIFLRPHVPDDPAVFAQVYASYAEAPERPGSGDDWWHVRLDDLRAIDARARTLTHLHGRREISAPLGAHGAVEVEGVLITCGALARPGQPPPVLGRLLDARDCATAAPVAVLGEPLWRERFGADAGVVGRALRYGPLTLTVVGVAATAAERKGRPRIFLPYTLHPAFPEGPRWAQVFQVTAHLTPGATRQAATAELAVLFAAQDGLHPGRRSAVVVTDGSHSQRPGRRALAYLLAGVLLAVVIMIVLLVAANVVALLLGRAHARRHEIAVRLALGAGRGRLLRMLLTETLVLAAAAAALSLPIARALPPLVVSWMEKEARLPPTMWAPDWRVWTFVVAVTMLATVSAGLAPALEAIHVDLTASLKGRLPAAAPTARRRDLRGLLIATQVAVSMALLAGAALFVHTYARKAAPEPGFEARQTLVAPLRLRRIDANVAWPDLQRALAAELAARPGVVATAFEQERPVERVRTEEGRRAEAWSLAVSPGHFAALGVPLLRGRALVAADPADGALVPVVVARAMALQLWPDRDPVGRQLRTREGARLEVVGVAGDVVRPGGPKPPALYRPLAPGQGTLLVRFSGNAAAARAEVLVAIRRVAPGFDSDPRTFQQRYDRAAEQLGRGALVALGLAVVALGLALVGVYGVVSFGARRRMKELGIRLALGAQRRHVLMALITPIARRVGLGVVAGLLIALALAPGLRTLFGELEVVSVPAYAGAALLMAAAAAAAMWGPARRALTADPLATLRED
jgi:predicted permease